VRVPRSHFEGPGYRCSKPSWARGDCLALLDPPFSARCRERSGSLLPSDLWRPERRRRYLFTHRRVVNRCDCRSRTTALESMRNFTGGCSTFFNGTRSSRWTGNAGKRKNGIEFLIGGGYAFGHYIGLQRHTKDFDLMVRPSPRSPPPFCAGTMANFLTFSWQNTP
jgi:hypothetical protein